MSKPKYLKRITKPSQLKAGVRYMRMYVNEYWVGNEICTPCGQMFAFHPDYESSQHGELLFAVAQESEYLPNKKFASTWLRDCYTVKWSHKAEAFFNSLKADETKRKAWTFLTGKFRDHDWQRQQAHWAADAEWSHELHRVCYEEPLFEDDGDSYLGNEGDGQGETGGTL